MGELIQLLHIRKKDAKREPREVPADNPYEFFRTPQWCVNRLVEAVPLPQGRWLEPAVGDGSIVKVINQRLQGVKWDTCDLVEYPNYKADMYGDFCHFPELDAYVLAGAPWDCICTNPPYSRAKEFVEHSLKRAKLVVMLLRLQWLSSEKRATLLREHTPDVYVLPNRPTFDGYGSDPKTDYGWFVWGSRAKGAPATLQILGSTPREERALG